MTTLLVVNSVGLIFRRDRFVDRKIYVAININVNMSIDTSNNV